MVYSKFAKEIAFQAKDKSITRKRFLWALAFSQKVRDQTKLKSVKSLKGLF